MTNRCKRCNAPVFRVDPGWPTARWMHSSIWYEHGEQKRSTERDTCAGEPIICVRIGVKRSSRKPDSQRSKVYAWEKTLVPHYYACSRPVGKDHQHDGHLAPMTIVECEAFANKIGRAYHWPKIRVKPTHHGGRAIGHYLIALGVQVRTRIVVCHEVAHLLTGDWHGPKFMRVYLDLLARYCKLPKRELRASAAKAKIKVAKTTDVRQPKKRAA